MRRSEDLATEIGRDDPVTMEYRQGTVIAWDVTEGTNQINVSGVIFDDVPVYGRIEAMSIRPGDVVGLLKWRSQYMILGLVGDPSTAANVTIKQGTLTIDGGKIVLRGGDDMVVEEGDIEVTGRDGDRSVRIGRAPSGGGQISTYHPNGTAHMTAGQVHIEATGQVVGQGFFVQQDDGTDLIATAPLSPGGQTIVQIRDPDGSLVLGTETGGLLERPFIEVPMYSTSSRGAAERDSDTEGTIWQGRMWVTHPGIHAQIRAWCGAGTTGRIRLRVNGTFMGGIDVTATSPTFYDFGNLLLPAGVRGTPYNFYNVEITAQRTSGSALVIVMPYGVTKRGAP